MTTLADNFNMVLPNNTMRTIFVDYYNTLNDLRGTADKYIGFFEQFTKDHSVETLFAGITVSTWDSSRHKVLIK